MRWTRAFLPTLKEDPADAEAVSHRLMLRAGLIRPLARGVYSYLPIAALKATLRLLLTDTGRIPVRRMVEAAPEELAARALVEKLGPAARACCEAAPHDGRTGGGTLPDVALAGWAVRVRTLLPGEDAVVASRPDAAPGAAGEHA